MKYWLLLILLLLGLVLSAVWFGGDPADGFSSTADPLESIPPESVEHAPVNGGAIAPTETRDRTPAEHPGLVESTDLATASHLLSLTLVDAKSGRALPGALGYWMSYEGQAWAQINDRSRQGLDSDLEVLAQTQGQAFRTNAQGVANLQVPNQAIFVCGRSDQLYGQIRVAAKQTQAELRLWADYALDIFVHTESGRALANFPLLLRDRDTDIGAVLFHTRSDASGRAKIRHLPTRLAEEPDSTDLLLTAAAPFLDPTSIPIDPKAWPQQTLDFEVGPFGTVTLSLQDHDGSLHLAPTRCMIQIEEPEPGYWRQINGFGPRDQMGVVSGQAIDGVVNFPYIGLGLQLEAAAWMDASNRPYDISIAGPIAQDENVTGVIWIERLRPRVSFRLLDLNDQPFRDLTLECVYRLDSSNIHTQAGYALKTDAEGRAEFIVTSSIDTLKDVIIRLEIRHRVGQVKLRKVLKLPQDLPPGGLDLGDVYLVLEPLLAAGRIVDGDGAGMAGVRLTVTASKGPGQGQPLRTDFFSSKQDGSFEIRGETEATEISLRASARGIPSQMVQFAPGTEGLIIRFDPPKYRLAGRLWVDEGIPANRLTVAAAPVDFAAGGTVGSGRLRSVRPKSSGEFELMLPDTEAVTLVVTDRRSKVVLAELRQVAPSAPGQESDPRLAQIDLRGLLHRFHLKFVDAAGLAVQEVEMKLADLPTLPTPGGTRAALMDGEGSFFLPTQSFAFIAYGGGQRTLSGSVRAPGNHTFSMQSGLAAVVHILPPEVLSTSNRAILYLKGVSEGTSDFNLWQKPANEQNELHFNFPAPGLYRPSVLIYRRNPDGKVQSQSFPGQDLAPLFEVLDITTEQTFDLNLDPESIAAFLAGE
jgi:hypothetical protein